MLISLGLDRDDLEAIGRLISNVGLALIQCANKIRVATVQTDNFVCLNNVDFLYFPTGRTTA